MSNNLIRLLGGVITSLFKKSAIDTAYLSSKATAALVLAGVHASYAVSTQRVEEIEIVSKYKMVNYGFTQFMVVDRTGRHLNVNNSFWFWKWDSVEDWSAMGKNEKYQVRYYGWRSPLLGLFPNIVGK
jgi:hypothetical protein